MSELTDTHRAALIETWLTAQRTRMRGSRIGTVPSLSKTRERPPAGAHDADQHGRDRHAVMGSQLVGLAAAADTRHEAAGEAQQFRQLRVEIASRVGRGDSLDSVEHELIAPSRLSEELKAALWLYGWSLPKLERPRRPLLPRVPGPARAPAAARPLPRRR